MKFDKILNLYVIQLNVRGKMLGINQSQFKIWIHLIKDETCISRLFSALKLANKKFIIWKLKHIITIKQRIHAELRYKAVVLSSHHCVTTKPRMNGIFQLCYNIRSYIRETNNTTQANFKHFDSVEYINNQMLDSLYSQQSPNVWISITG